MRVLVLGAYGLIGAEVVRALASAGHEVVGLVRSRRVGARLLPGVDCIEADIARLNDAGAWRPVVSGFDAVVNASGALQTGLRDNVSAVQDDAIKALIQSSEESQVSTFIQISAPGAELDASTEFMRSKARADAALRASSLNWAIFKPGLVIARAAYGGTSLIRALASFPLAQPVTFGDARIQTVSATEVGGAVAAALDGRVSMRQDYDLMETTPHTLTEIILEFRRWLGFGEPLLVIRVPRSLGYGLALFGDLAGWLGWRAPLRSTALRVLEKDVTGDPGGWTEQTGQRLRSLRETLAETPSTAQERIFAKSQLLFPVALLTLSGFFLASGVIAAFRSDAAAGVLSGVMNEGAARFLVKAGSVADIALGCAVLARFWTKTAAAGIIALCIGYLIMGTIFTPALWLDPLGPFVKIFPVAALALYILLMVDER